MENTAENTKTQSWKSCGFQDSFFGGVGSMIELEAKPAHGRLDGSSPSRPIAPSSWSSSSQTGP